MAATEPTLPTAIDYSVNSTPIRTVNVTSGDATALQAALDDATFGDEIVLPVATYTGQFTLTVPAGSIGGGSGGPPAATSRPAVSSRPAVTPTAVSARPAISMASGGENWVTIRSASGSIPSAGTQVTASDISNMPTIVAETGSDANYAISSSENGIHHIRFVGINFTTPQYVNGVGGIISISCPDQTAAINYPHHISIERCVVKPHYDFGPNIAITFLGTDNQIIDSHIDEVKLYGNGEAKGIFFNNYSGPVKIHNNYLGGAGSNLFIGDSLKGGVAITAGYEYEQPHDITITGNTFGRNMQWKRDHASYIPQCQVGGSGTVSSSGTTVTFSTSQSGLIGKYIKGATSGAVGLVASGSGTSWVVSWKSGTAFSAGESWRFNAGNIGSKNMVELKAGNKVYINGNTFQNYWTDGQYFALTLTPRSYGWFEDITITDNYFNNCCGPVNFSVGDHEAGNGLGASPRASSKLRFSNNLCVDSDATSMQSLAVNPYTFAISPFASLYGRLDGIEGFIQATAITGTGVPFLAGSAGTGTFSSSGFNLTFSSDQTANLSTSHYVRNSVTGQIAKISGGSGTSWTTETAFSPAASAGTAFTFSLPVFGNESAGDGTNMQIKYLNGVATVKTYVSRMEITADITTAFADTTRHDTDLWYIGLSSLVKTSVFHWDSLIIEHNSLVGSGAGTRKIGVLNNPDATNLCTNIVWRNNLAFTIDGGFQTDGSVPGTGAITYFADSSTKDIQKNVFFGPDLVGGGINYAQYYNGEAVDEVLGFHDPDQTGSGSGGSVGFVDYAGGNYRLTGAYAIAATDGTMIGCNVDTVAAATGQSL